VFITRPLFVTMMLGLAAGPLADAARAQSVMDPQKRLEALINATPMPEPAQGAKALADFYRQRGYQPAWNGEQGDRLLADIPTRAEAEGLDPAAYGLAAGTTDLQRDVAISAALLRLGRDAAIGAVAPERSYGGFGADTRGRFDGATFLRGLAEGRPLGDQLAAATPPFVGYLRLKEALEKLRAQARAGDWPTVPDGPKLVPGDSDDRVLMVRKRLIASGELDPVLADSRTLDQPLVDAVKRFQARHGLEADGTIGARTLANLNVSAAQRAHQIAVNLERWRWMVRNPGRHHVLINIPAAHLDAVEDGGVLLSMRVVVGDTKHPTPSLATTMSSLVLNPPWSVPASIANKEILPKLKRDPHYLETAKLKILDQPEDGSGTAGDTIDWNAIGKKFPYRLRQPPGPDNALGQLKFNLMDSDDIYMHDTPNRKVFGRSYRALSHGCVRLEHPVLLGELMLGARWRDRLGADIAANAHTRTLKLERTVAVYMVYFTAWGAEDGTIQFRDDLYGHDRRLGAVLNRAWAPPARSLTKPS
jgi:murein L,D-transpeptidase YcbB/YkuD